MTTVDFQTRLKQFVSKNPKLVTMKPAGDGMYVLKYTRTVFHNNLWNDLLEECRGTIVDEDFNVIARPFTKIYNYGIERQSPKFEDNTVVTAYRKVNGFMAAITWHKDDILVSTTGSTTSEYVQYIKDMMLMHMSWNDWRIEVCAAQGKTLMFECVHPADPHICPEKPGLYFIGHRVNTWDSKVDGYGAHDMWSSYSNQLSCNPVESLVLPLDELQEKAKSTTHEGWVFYAADGRSAKIKSKHYLVQKAFARKKDIARLDKRFIDEEFYPLVDYLMSIKDQFNELSEQQRLEYMRSFLEGMK